MPHLQKNSHGCPTLFLAPMEGVGDRCFRKAMATVGGFDQATTDFLRVPTNAHVVSLAKDYQHDELETIPLAAQIMGSDPDLMADMANELVKRGAPRIDVNCGCPSYRVTGRGAGSSLLKDPSFVHEVASAVVKAVSVPVTIKMRSGFDDTSLFQENLLAAQESGVAYLTLHPRTKVDGYGPPARWDLIAQAKNLLKIPVVGNGDILTVNDAHEMLKQTNCDALMIGRGSLVNPFIFHEIKASFSKEPYTAKDFIRFVTAYYGELSPDVPNRTKINKLKQLLGFIFKSRESLAQARNQILTSKETDPSVFLQTAFSYL